MRLQTLDRRKSCGNLAHLAPRQSRTPAQPAAGRLAGARSRLGSPAVNFARDVVGAAPPDRPALVALGLDGARREIAFGEVADRSARLAGTLQGRGVGRGDVVLTLVGNRPEWV